MSLSRKADLDFPGFGNFVKFLKKEIKTLGVILLQFDWFAAAAFFRAQYSNKPWIHRRIQESSVTLTETKKRNIVVLAASNARRRASSFIIRPIHDCGLYFLIQRTLGCDTLEWVNGITNLVRVWCAACGTRIDLRNSTFRCRFRVRSLNSGCASIQYFSSPKTASVKSKILRSNEDRYCVNEKSVMKLLCFVFILQPVIQCYK